MTDDPNKKLAGEIIEKFRKSENNTRTMNNLKRLWLALYLDQQFSWINKLGEFATLTDDEIKRLRNSKRTYPIFLNLIKSIVMLVVSQLTQKQTKVQFLPKGVGQDVFYASQATNDILDAFRFAQDYTRDDKKNATWMTVVGDSYKWTHPKEASDKSIELPVKDDQGEPKLDKNGRPLMERIPVELEVTTEVLPWTSFFPPPGEKEIPEMPWIILKRDLDKTFLNDRYGTELSAKSANWVDSYNIEEHTHSHSYEQFGEQIAVLDYLEKPTQAYPRGRHVVVVLNDEIILEQGDFPYWIKVPMYQADPQGNETAVAGQFEEKWGGYRVQHYTYHDSLISHWAQGLPSPIADIQKRINHILTAWITNVITTMGVKLPYFDSMSLPKDFLDNEPKAVQIPAGQTIPQYMNPPTVNPEVMTAIRLLIAELYQIAGVNQVTMGGSPEQRTSNAAMQTTISTDLNKLRPILDNYADTECRTAWDIYHSIRQFSPEYAKRVLGPDRVAELNDFLSSDPEDYELKAELESNIPENKEGNIETIERIIKATQGQILGGFKEPADFANLMRAVDTGWSRDWIKQYTQPAELVETENRMMLNGQMPVVSLFHDHPLHMTGHQKPYNSPEYYTKINGTQIDSIFQKHQIEHNNMMIYGVAQPTQQMIAQHQQALAMKAQAAMGGKPQPEAQPEQAQ